MATNIHKASFSIQQTDDAWRLVIFDQENQVKDIIEDQDPEVIVSTLIAFQTPLEFVKALNEQRSIKKQKLVRV